MSLPTYMNEETGQEEPLYTLKYVPPLIDLVKNDIGTYNFRKYRKHRKVYKTLIDQRSDDYQDKIYDNPRLSGLYDEYLNLKVAKISERDITKTDRNILINEVYKKPQQEIQQEISKEYLECLDFLIAYYEELDEKINSEEYEDIFEDDFNYDGYAITYRYLSRQKKVDIIDPEFNEFSKWLYILENLNDSEIRKLHNPYVQKEILSKLFKHPLLGVELDFTLGDRNIANVSKLAKKFQERFKTARKAIAAAKRDSKLLPRDNSVSSRTIGYEDGEEYMLAVRMYFWANRFANCYSKYPKRVSLSGCGVFSGWGNDRSLSKRRNLLEETRTSIQNDIEQANLNHLGEDEIKHLQELYNSADKFLQAIGFVTSKIGVIAEQTLQNPYASNSSGALVTLKYNENGSYNGDVETPTPKEIKISFAKNVQYES